MCQRAMCFRPCRCGVYKGIHLDKDKFSVKEWDEICSKRIELSLQDPDDLMSYEVFC